MQRPESVRRPAIDAPLRHPHFETYQARDRAAFVAEVAAFVRLADAERARMAAVRVLESVH